MTTATLLKQLGLQCAVPDCLSHAEDVLPISISNAPKKNLPVCSQHADAAADDMWKKHKTESKKASDDTLRLRINLDGDEHDVSRKAYVTAKTKQMREFGYQTTEAEVDAQIEILMTPGKPANSKLTVIGMFMKDEIVLPTT